jgi:hypothetical protein
MQQATQMVVANKMLACLVQINIDLETMNSRFSTVSVLPYQLLSSFLRLRER